MAAEWRACALVAMTILALSGARTEAAAPRPAACFGSRDLPSPDGALIAHVRRLGARGCGESRVEIVDRAGHVLAKRGFTSPDGQQGGTVQRAGWSADSRFFAFSLFSSGGHQAEHYPTLVFSRADDQIRDIEKAKPGLFVASPDFRFERDGIGVSDLARGPTVVRLGGRPRGAAAR